MREDNFSHNIQYKLAKANDMIFIEKQPVCFYLECVHCQTFPTCHVSVNRFDPIGNLLLIIEQWNLATQFESSQTSIGDQSVVACGEV